jgi:hypothetical protein
VMLAVFTFGKIHTNSTGAAAVIPAAAV